MYKFFAGICVLMIGLTLPAFAGDGPPDSATYPATNNVSNCTPNCPSNTPPMSPTWRMTGETRDYGKCFYDNEMGGTDFYYNKADGYYYDSAPADGKQQSGEPTKWEPWPCNRHGAG